ncbi:MAG: hypothetical protein V4850_36555 [Myxococcota bacterium]
MIQLGWMILSGGVWGAEPGPAERALFAWADKCPSTAMGAGLYEGEGAESVPLGAGNVLRVRTRSEGASPTGSVTQTVWMLGGECRAVGLVEQWGKGDGDPTRHVGFVVAKEGGAPRADEQAVLSGWAGQRVWDATKPAHAAATAAFSVVVPEEIVVGEGLAVTLTRRPARVWVPGPVPTSFEEAWRPSSVAPDDTTCPCWVVYPALASAPVSSAPPDKGPFVSRFYGSPLGPRAHVVEDAARARWAIEPSDPTSAPTSGPSVIQGTVPAALARFRWVGASAASDGHAAVGCDEAGARGGRLGQVGRLRSRHRRVVRGAGAPRRGVRVVTDGAPRRERRDPDRHVARLAGGRRAIA